VGKGRQDFAAGTRGLLFLSLRFGPLLSATGIAQNRTAPEPLSPPGGSVSRFFYGNYTTPSTGPSAIPSLPTTSN